MLTARYFTTKDKAKNKYSGFTLPKTWWSRIYEYEWALQFVGKNDVILDGGCGLMHPLKFVAAETAKEVCACDNDPRVEDKEETLAEIKKYCDDETVEYASKQFKKVKHKYIDLKDIVQTYGENKFDKIFCISVLEHMASDAVEVLKQFEKALKPGGKLIITCDYPVLSVEGLEYIVNENTKLKFCGKVDMTIPKDVVKGPYNGLKCFRAVLEKKKPLISYKKNYNKKVIEVSETKLK